MSEQKERKQDAQEEMKSPQTTAQNTSSNEEGMSNNTKSFLIRIALIIVFFIIAPMLHLPKGAIVFVGIVCMVIGAYSTYLRYFGK